MKQYDPETLGRLHRFTVNMLQDFIKVCEKYEIPYFSVYGTALGAIRHKGFIPWDDDLDVAMMREDYERFLSVMPQELGDKYAILNTGVNKEYTCSVIHFGRKGTIFVPEHTRHMKCEQNICFDIFVYDDVPDDPKKTKKANSLGMVLVEIIVLERDTSSRYSFEGMEKGSCLVNLLFDPFCVDII